MEKILNALPCGVMVIDEKGNVTFVNKLAEVLSNLEPDEETETYIYDGRHYRLIEKPFNGGKLVVYLDVTDEMKAREFMIIDPETGVFTAKFLAQEIENQMDRVHATGSQMALVLIDVDPGENGPSMREIAETLKKSVKSYDIVSRCDRADFAVIMFAIDPDKIDKQAGEKLLKALKEIGVAKASIGITLSGKATSATIMIRQAQRALYVVNMRGGNDYSIY